MQKKIEITTAAEYFQSIQGSQGQESKSLKEEESELVTKSEPPKDVTGNLVDYLLGGEVKSKAHYMVWLIATLRNITVSSKHAAEVVLKTNEKIEDHSDKLVKWTGISLKNGLVNSFALLEFIRHITTSPDYTSLLENSAATLTRQRAPMFNFIYLILTNLFRDRTAQAIIDQMATKSFLFPIMSYFIHLLNSKKILPKDIEKFVKTIDSKSYDSDPAIKRFIDDCVKINLDYFFESVQKAINNSRMIPKIMLENGRWMNQIFLFALYNSERSDMVSIGNYKFFMAEIVDLQAKQQFKKDHVLMMLKETDQGVKLINIQDELFKPYSKQKNKPRAEFLLKSEENDDIYLIGSQIDPMKKPEELVVMKLTVENEIPKLEIVTDNKLPNLMNKQLLSIKEFETDEQFFKQKLTKPELIKLASLVQLLSSEILGKFSKQYGVLSEEYDQIIQFAQVYASISRLEIKKSCRTPEQRKIAYDLAKYIYPNRLKLVEQLEKINELKDYLATIKNNVINNQKNLSKVADWTEFKEIISTEKTNREYADKKFELFKTLISDDTQLIELQTFWDTEKSQKLKKIEKKELSVIIANKQIKINDELQLIDKVSNHLDEFYKEQFSRLEGLSEKAPEAEILIKHFGEWISPKNVGKFRAWQKLKLELNAFVLPSFCLNDFIIPITNINQLAQWITQATFGGVIIENFRQVLTENFCVQAGIAIEKENKETEKLNLLGRIALKLINLVKNNKIEKYQEKFSDQKDVELLTKAGAHFLREVMVTPFIKIAALQPSTYKELCNYELLDEAFLLDECKDMDQIDGYKFLRKKILASNILENSTTQNLYLTVMSLFSYEKQTGDIKDEKVKKAKLMLYPKPECKEFKVELIESTHYDLLKHIGKQIPEEEFYLVAIADALLNNYNGLVETYLKEIRSKDFIKQSVLDFINKPLPNIKNSIGKPLNLIELAIFCENKLFFSIIKPYVKDKDFVDKLSYATQALGQTSQEFVQELKKQLNQLYPSFKKSNHYAMFSNKQNNNNKTSKINKSKDEYFSSSAPEQTRSHSNSFGGD